MESILFQNLKIRDITLRNRIVISPMCQYSAKDGFANDFHFVHLGRFAMGGAGLVMTEAVSVSPQGRITHGDLGLWNDEQISGFKRIADFIKNQGAAAGIQIAHAGRKASMQRPWFGNGPLTSEDVERGDHAWPIVAPSAVGVAKDWLVPEALDESGLERVKKEFISAATRAIAAGFDVLELHCAHGYLLHQFLSPLSNKRSDSYGGDLESRMRFPLEIAQEIRAVWPDDKPMFTRVSAVDNVEGGLTIEDTIAFSERLAEIGVDVVDCSSGGMLGSPTADPVKTDYGYQVPLSESIRSSVNIRTMAVGLIVEPEQASNILSKGQADLIAIGREALANPNWSFAAQGALATDGGPGKSVLPYQHSWWLARRSSLLSKLGSWRGSK